MLQSCSVQLQTGNAMLHYSRCCMNMACTAFQLCTLRASHFISYCKTSPLYKVQK